MAVVIQCFIKRDTLAGALDSLLACIGVSDVELIIWSDSPEGSRHPERYKRLATEVELFLFDFVSRNQDRFASVELQRNIINLGTCKTCEVALNYAFSRNTFVLFVEDDVVFARDALLWFDVLRRQEVLAAERVWAIAGESVFFNARGEVLPDGWAERMRSLAINEDLVTFYTESRFVPSTCFATNRIKWAQFGRTRGKPQGDVELCERCQKEDRYAVFPIVARVRDIGMLHEDGYSVSIHGRSGVSEIKNTYLTSDDVIPADAEAPGALEFYIGIAGRIYTLSTLLTTV